MGVPIVWGDREGEALAEPNFRGPGSHFGQEVRLGGSLALPSDAPIRRDTLENRVSLWIFGFALSLTFALSLFSSEKQ